MTDANEASTASRRRLAVLATLSLRHEPGPAGRGAVFPHGRGQGLRPVQGRHPSGVDARSHRLALPTRLRGDQGPLALPRPGSAGRQRRPRGRRVGRRGLHGGARVSDRARPLPGLRHALRDARGCSGSWPTSRRASTSSCPATAGTCSRCAPSTARRTLDAYLAFIRSGGRRIFDIYPDLNTGYLDMDDGRYGDPERALHERQHPGGAGGGSARPPRPARRAGARRSSPASGPSWTRPLSRWCRSSARRSRARPRWSWECIKELRRRGYRVAVLKHDTHGFEVDVPGTDSYRFREAGAEVVGISSPDKYVWQ